MYVSQKVYVCERTFVHGCVWVYVGFRCMRMCMHLCACVCMCMSMLVYIALLRSMCILEKEFAINKETALNAVLMWLSVVAILVGSSYIDSFSFRFI